MDGKGAWRDNIFVERLWRSVKYEEVYLKAYQSVSEARASIGRYLHFYNTLRPHLALDRQSPDEDYFWREKCRDGRMTIAPFLMQLWSGYALPPPHQKRKTSHSVQLGRNPLNFRGELFKQAGPSQ
jgi:putative transposase